MPLLAGLLLGTSVVGAVPLSPDDAGETKPPPVTPTTAAASVAALPRPWPELLGEAGGKATGKPLSGALRKQFFGSTTDDEYVVYPLADDQAVGWVVVRFTNARRVGVFAVELACAAPTVVPGAASIAALMRAVPAADRELRTQLRPLDWLYTSLVVRVWARPAVSTTEWLHPQTLAPVLRMARQGDVRWPDFETGAVGDEVGTDARLLETARERYLQLLAAGALATPLPADCAPALNSASAQALGPDFRGTKADHHAQLRWDSVAPVLRVSAGATRTEALEQLAGQGFTVVSESPRVQANRAHAGGRESLQLGFGEDATLATYAATSLFLPGSGSDADAVQDMATRLVAVLGAPDVETHERGAVGGVSSNLAWRRGLQVDYAQRAYDGADSPGPGARVIFLEVR